MNTRKITRRKFLSNIAKGTIGYSFLTQIGCTTFDPFYYGDSQEFENEVIILGGGLSGLVAAYQFKKNRIPFRVFEASGRPGGRILTYNNYSGANKYIELGADSFNKSQKNVMQLCSELQIKSIEKEISKKFAQNAFNLNKSKFNLEKNQFSKILNRIKKDISLSDKNNKALYQYDEVTVAELLNYMQKDISADFIKWWRDEIQIRQGLDILNTSSLQLISNLEQTNVLDNESHLTFPRGLSELVDLLYERISGAVPGLLVKTNSQLVKIKDKKDYFELYFNSNGRRQLIKAKDIVSTIPLIPFRQIEGINDLDFSDLRKSWIQSVRYSSQDSWYVFLENSLTNTRSLNYESDKKIIWDVQKDVLKLSSIDSLTREQVIQLVTQEFQLGSNKIKDVFNFNWKNKSLQGGQFSYMSQGDYKKYELLQNEIPLDGRFIFAGEHTVPLQQGALEKAVVSGIKAAEIMIQKKKVSKLSV